MTVVGKSSAIAQYEQSKRRRLVTRRKAAVSAALRQMHSAMDLEDPCAEIVRDLAGATVETLPSVIERARKMRADGGV